jgi:phenylacetate-CoA ligase
MSEDNLALYVQELRRLQPQFLYGYPSALTLLARFVASHPEVKFPQVKALLCGSESVLDGQREFLERVLHTRFYSWYGMSEKVILAGECEKSTLYHAFPQYGVTEIRDDAGDLSSREGADGELVGTGFMNTAMPFIRYRLGDYARIEHDACNACGRPWTILGPVQGHRLQEMILGRNGAAISLTALNMHGDVFAGVLRFQFRQVERGRATVVVVPSANFSEKHAERIRRAQMEKTGDEVEWRVELAKNIELTDRGKAILLVRRIPGVDIP